MSFDISNNFIIDALKFHYNVIIDEVNPDYLFCSCFGKRHLKYENAIKIFYSGENISADYNLYDYAIDFDHIEFNDRHLRYPLHVIYNTKLNKPKISDSDALNREFCNFVYSNSIYADSKRIEIFNKLGQYKRVDSGGRYLNNIEGGAVVDKISFLRKYKFSIAFENSSKRGYTTEKILDPLVAGSVPIYWGNPTVHTDFNPRAFINAHDFANIDELVKEVIRIDSNNNAYLEMLNEPFYNGDQDFKNIKNKELSDFLIRIIEQPVHKAKRRTENGYTRGLMRDAYYLMKSETTLIPMIIKKGLFFYFRRFNNAKKWKF